MRNKGQLHGAILYMMKNRYGKNDLLNKHTMLLSFLGLLITPFMTWRYFILFPLLLLCTSYLRIFSKNKIARANENKKYTRFIRSLGLFDEESKSKESSYYYINCTKCHQKLRLPKKKVSGKNIVITCPKCHNKDKIKT